MTRSASVRPSLQALDRRLLVFIVVGFLLGGVVNVFWEVQVTRVVAPTERAVLVRDDGRLITLTVSEPFGSRNKFSILAALLDFGRGGVLRVPDPTLVNDEFVLNLAQMTLETDEYQPNLSQEEAELLLEHVRFKGRGRLNSGQPVVEFLIIARDSTSTSGVLRLLFWEDTLLFVDEALFREVRA